jgi:hypothetical protein
VKRFAILTVCLTVALVLAAAKTPIPRVAFTAEVREFAEVESGTAVPAEFPFRNDGDADLVVAEVRATCECTEARAEPTTVPPGGAGTIFVTLDTAYRVGDLDKEVVVRTNDPARPEVVLHLKGRTFQPLTFKPGPLFLTDLVPGKKAVADVTLMNTGRGPVTVKEVRTADFDLGLAVTGPGDAPVTLPTTLPVGAYLWVRLTLTPGPARGDLVRQVAVVADPPPRIPVVLKILGTFRPTSKESR